MFITGVSRGESKNTITNMEKTVNIDLKRREELVALLRDKKAVECRALEYRTEADMASILRKYAEEKGYLKLKAEQATISDKMLELEKQKELISTSIQRLGIDDEGDRLNLHWSAPQKLRTFIAAERDKAQRPITKALEKYDIAISNVWIAETPDDYRKAVAGLF